MQIVKKSDCYSNKQRKWKSKGGGPCVCQWGNLGRHSDSQ